MLQDAARGAPVPMPIARLLRRTHWRVMVVALLIVGASTAAATLFVLRSEGARSLALVARSAAFAAEAAVLFEDGEAAEELLRNLAERERLAQVSITLQGGRLLARVERKPANWVGSLTNRLARLVFQTDATTVVERKGRVLATVWLRDDGQALAEVLVGYLLGIAGAMLATVVLVAQATRRTQADLGGPMLRLAQFTRTVREGRAYEQRAPASGIAEIDALADDFNALLAEVQAQQTELLARQAGLHRHNQTLQQQVLHDVLTGLPNRAQFQLRLQQALAQAEAQDQGLGVMFVDADHFKTINDTLGHAVGDRVLVAIGQRIQGALREADLVARLGGDEFAVLLWPLNDAADAQVVAAKIAQAMTEPLALDGGRSVPLRVSLGLARYPADGDSADAAMYAVKRQRHRAPAG